jgi:hypothetical protein
MADIACHVFGSTTHVGLTQALCGNAFKIAVVLPSVALPHRLALAPVSAPGLSGDRPARRFAVRLTYFRAPIVGDFGDSLPPGFLPKLWS